MQEVWDEIEEHGTLYNRLWKFGLRALRSRECGLYEASDILLGKHLCEKSDNVQWVNVCKPDLRKIGIKSIMSCSNHQRQTQTLTIYTSYIFWMISILKDLTI